MGFYVDLIAWLQATLEMNDNDRVEKKKEKPGFISCWSTGLQKLVSFHSSTEPKYAAK